MSSYDHQQHCTHLRWSWETATESRERIWPANLFPKFASTRVRFKLAAIQVSIDQSLCREEVSIKSRECLREREASYWKHWKWRDPFAFIKGEWIVCVDCRIVLPRPPPTTVVRTEFHDSVNSGRNSSRYIFINGICSLAIHLGTRLLKRNMMNNSLPSNCFLILSLKFCYLWIHNFNARKNCTPSSIFAQLNISIIYYNSIGIFWWDKIQV